MGQWPKQQIANGARGTEMPALATSTKTEFEKARAWRRARALSVERLSELSGYAPETIYLMERGVNANSEPVSEFAWYRYRNVCAGVDARLRSGIVFDWGE